MFFYIFIPIPGEMIQFDEHIFQMGWFNHQLEKQIPKLHQGKSRWHSYHVLVYISPALTYLLQTVPCTLTIVYSVFLLSPWSQMYVR